MVDRRKIKQILQRHEGRKSCISCKNSGSMAVQMPTHDPEKVQLWCSSLELGPVYLINDPKLYVCTEHFPSVSDDVTEILPTPSSRDNSQCLEETDQVQPTRQVPVHPDVKFIKLPFYDVHAELLRPASLLSHGNNRFQDASFQFFLTPGQATDIASNRDIRMGSKMEYLYQIQLRFCPLSLEPNKEMSDEFPPSVCVQVNGKMAQLPNPIPTNKPGVEPKRPPRPVNITPLCKLTPILPNNISIKWAAEYGKGWVVGIWLVMKLTSDDLLERLKKKGSRKPEFTRSLIIEKLKDDDCDVATTSLKVSVACPLGKMRMALPCRPSTCSHLQCFDASLFLQMNERKPTWTCPVCDSKALYDTLMIDGYFQDVIKSDKLPRDDNEIILEEDGEWRPVPKEEAAQEKPKEAAPKPTEEEVDCIDLSDDEDIPLPPTAAPPPLPPQMALDQPPPPPPPPQEIECIDLE